MVKLRVQAFNYYAILPQYLDRNFPPNGIPTTEIFKSNVRLEVPQAMDSICSPALPSHISQSTGSETTDCKVLTRGCDSSKVRQGRFILCKMQCFTIGYPYHYFNLQGGRKCNHAFTYIHFLASSLYFHLHQWEEKVSSLVSDKVIYEHGKQGM